MSIWLIIFLLNLIGWGPIIVSYFFKRIRNKHAYEKSLQAQIDAERRLIRETLHTSEDIQHWAGQNKTIYGKCLYCGALVKDGKCVACGASAVSDSDLQNTEVLKALEYKHLERIQELEEMKYRAKLDHQKQVKDGIIAAVCIIAGFMVFIAIAYFQTRN